MLPRTIGRSPWQAYGWTTIGDLIAFVVDTTIRPRYIRTQEPSGMKSSLVLFKG